MACTNSQLQIQLDTLIHTVTQRYTVTVRDGNYTHVCTQHMPHINSHTVTHRQTHRTEREATVTQEHTHMQPGSHGGHGTTEKYIVSSCANHPFLPVQTLRP